jgi:hypothetical protein
MLVVVSLLQKICQTMKNPKKINQVKEINNE